MRAKRLFSLLEQECAHNILSTITTRHRSTAPTLRLLSTAVILDFEKMFALLQTILALYNNALCGLERDNCGATFRFCGHDV